MLGIIQFPKNSAILVAYEFRDKILIFDLVLDKLT